ncbi:4-oxalocrotonate tautomerase DmpI [Methanobrevibacter cuticularis]|nr:4-oxalocrotonate tautomerase DmpI [Methanobrevibacter cuticularis]
MKQLKGENEMPYITVESGQLTIAQKEELISKLTDISSKIMNIPQDSFMVAIKELPNKNIGIGGKSIAIIKEEYMARMGEVKNKLVFYIQKYKNFSKILKLWGIW